MSEHTPLEPIIDVHPLDEIGYKINEILENGGHITKTQNGYTMSRNIQAGDVSLFFSRIDNPRNRRFVVGVDEINDKEGTLSPLRTFEWSIYDPSGSGITDNDLGRLGIVTKVAINMVSLDGEA
jgi:hypothetical protein